MSPSTYKYLFKLHTKTYLPEPLYETHIIFFLSRSFSSPSIWVAIVLQILYQVAHKDIYVKLITWKTEIQPQKTTNMAEKKKTIITLLKKKHIIS